MNDNDNHKLYNEPLISFKLQQFHAVILIVSLSAKVLRVSS